MAAIDRNKYMDVEELRILRTVTEAWAITDLRAGRVTGVLAWAVVDVVLSTGLRVSELAALTVGDFNARRGSLKVARRKRRKPVTETLALSKELTRHLSEFVEWKKQVGEPVRAASRLFAGKRGAMTPSGLQRVWKRAAARAGLPEELSIHCARHTIAVHLLKKTGNLRLVQKQLGHSNPATTANMYADVSFADMQDAATGLYGNGGCEKR